MNDKLSHDITNQISALKSAVEMLEEEWSSRPSFESNLLDQVIQLSSEKMTELRNNIKNYHSDN